MSLPGKIRPMERWAGLRERGPDRDFPIDNIDLFRFDSVGENKKQFVERVEMVPVSIFTTQLASHFLRKRNQTTVFPYVVAGEQVYAAGAGGRKDAPDLEEEV